MTKRFIPIFSIILLLISLIAPGIQPVAAEEKEDVEYEDGDYEIIAKALHADKDEASGAAGFINEKAKIIVGDGEIKLALTIPNNDMAEIEGLQIEGNNPEIKDQDNSKVYTYTLNELKETLEAQTQYVVPALNMNHDVPLRFKLEGLDTIPEVEEPENEEKPEESEDTGKNEENPEEDSDKPGNEEEEKPEESDGDKSEDEDEGSKEEPEKELSLDNLQDGQYKVKASYINEKTGKDSTMARYLEDEIFVEVKNGKTELTVSVNDSNTVTKLEVEDNKPLKQLKEENTRHEVFAFNDLSTDLKAYVEYQVPMGGGKIHKGNAEFLISLDEASIKEAKASDKPTGEVIDEEKPDPSEKPEEDSGDDSKLNPKKLEAGTYKLDYTFLEKGQNNLSTMDGFTDGPAYVKVNKKGEKSIAITLTSSSMIEYFKVNGKNAKTLQEDKDKDTKVVEFPVKDLTKKQSGAVFVEVPDMYSTEHEVDLEFDISTLKESKNYPKDENVDSGEENDSTPNPSKPEIPEKPVNEDLDPKNLDAGSYKIEYSFLEKDTDTVSIMDGFTDGPAYIKKDKNGNQRVAITFTSADYIKGFEVNGTPAKVLQVDKKKDTMVAEFPVDDLTKKQNAWVAVKVPGVYDTEHDVDLVFHVTTLDDVKQYPQDKKPENIFTKSSGQEKQGQGEGPDFDRDADGNLIGSNDNNNNQSINPKTADLNMTQIMWFGSLLLLSLIPLAVKLRRRFVTEK